MKSIFRDYPLKSYNTFNIEASSKYFITCGNIKELREILDSQIVEEHPLLVLGGGSNVLFMGDYQGVVIYPELKGKKIIQENSNKVRIKVGCGEDWDSFVEYCVENGYGGIENLSGIPGRVGAVPIQNIGAYGVEAQESIVSVESLEIESGQKVNFKREECQFGYRDSIFKHHYKNKYIITSVIFELSKNPDLVMNYGDLQERITNQAEKNIKTVRDIILQVRNEKLPAPEKLGNAGSFFKNPIIEREKLESLTETYDELPYYNLGDSQYKIPAGWLIEECGWKEKSYGEAGVYQDQALIIVNYGEASGKEIYGLSQKIKKDVQNKFGIELEREVKVVTSD